MDYDTTLAIPRMLWYASGDVQGRNDLVALAVQYCADHNVPTAGAAQQATIEFDNDVTTTYAYSDPGPVDPGQGSSNPEGP